MTADAIRAGRVARLRPFDMSDIERAADGVLGYRNLPASLVTMLRASVEAHPHDEALVELDGERLTYSELWDRAAAVAGGLRQAGLHAGDRAAIRLPNGADWVVALCGCQLAGVVAVPVNTRFSANEAQHVIDDSGSIFAFEPGAPLPAGAPLAVDTGAPDDLAAIFYTSGTTGFPKGAMATHANLLATCETRTRVTSTAGEAGLRNLVSVPLFHVTGCISQLLFTMYRAGTTVIMPAFDVQAFLRTIVEERIDICTSVPAIYWLALNQPNFGDFDFDHLRYLSYGGAPMAPDVIAKVRAGFPNAKLGNGYGLTETSAICTFLPDAWCDTRPETVGFAAPVVELDLAGLDPSTGVGELLARGQNVVRGYWRAPEQTADTFVDGWLHTGDLARIDEEGFVQIVDRKKDMVNRGGENVYCVEVENALVQHPGVFEVAVLGVPDTMMGEKVGAVIVPTPGAEPDPTAIRAWARERIADFKVPQYVALRRELLPRNAGGKVLKDVLRAETVWGGELR